MAQALGMYYGGAPVISNDCIREQERPKIWENILNVARDLSRLAKLYENEIGAPKLRRVQRLLAAFHYSLRFRIRPNSIMKKIDDPEFVRDPDYFLILYEGHGELQLSQCSINLGAAYICQQLNSSFF